MSCNAGGSSALSASIIFLRIAAVLASAISLRPTEAKNSLSWIFMRSQGGFPTTQVNPPCQPVVDSAPEVSESGTVKMPGNSRCQWKKRYC